MDDYSFLQDLLQTWRSTSDWVKAVVVLAIPGYAGLFTWLVLSHRADMRAVEKIEAGSLLSDERIRELTRAEMCRIAAEWERARKARAAAAPKLRDETTNMLTNRPANRLRRPRS